MAEGTGRGGALPVGADVVVVGAGIVGCATAYAMARAGLDVLVLERAGIGAAVSGASLACIGAHMVSREELALLVRARALWAELENDLGAGFEHERRGQLRFVTREEDIAHVQAWLDAETAAGVRVELLAPEAVRRLVPALEGDIAAATWSPDDATVNPFLACEALIAAAARRGARALAHTPLEGIELERGRVVAVRAAGRRVAARWVVNAAGPWAKRVAAMAGVTIPLRPRKAQCLATEALPPAIPCVVGACETGGGVEAGYTQIQQARAGQVLFNTVLGGGVGEDGAQDAVPEIDHRFLIDSVRTLLWLFPSLAEAQLLRSWVRYEAVTPDDRFILGPVAGAEGFLMAAGDCGTGFTRAPIIGRLLAELVSEGRPSMSLAPYALARFHGRPEAA